MERRGSGFDGRLAGETRSPSEGELEARSPGPQERLLHLENDPRPSTRALLPQPGSLTALDGSGPSASSPARSRDHLPALDGLRGLAVLLVMCFHLAGGSKHESAASALVYQLATGGWCGVDLFFVLSGFLITGILDDAKDRPHYFRNFFSRRFLRIFPLYYGVLFLVFVLIPRLVTSQTPEMQFALEHQGWFWLYGSNLLAAARGEWLFGHDWLRLNHFWSLAIEEQFYLLWPAVILWLSRRQAMAACLGLVVMSIGLRSWLVGTGHAWVTPYAFTFCRMDALAVGGFLALSVRRGWLTGMVRPARIVVALGLLTIAGIYARMHTVSEATPAMQTLGYFFLAFFFGALLIVSITARSASMVARVFTHPLMRTAGKYSYGLYVFHPFVLALLQRQLGPDAISDWTGSPFVGIVSYVMLASMLTLATAMLSWHLYEKHFLKLKRYFETG